MLARILFNLALIFAVFAGILATVRWGAGHGLVAAGTVFLSGFLFAFFVGLVKGAASVGNR